MKAGINDSTKSPRARRRRIVLGSLLVVTLVALLVVVLWSGDETQSATTAAVVELINEERVESIKQSDNTLLITLKDNDSPEYEVTVSDDIGVLPDFLISSGANAELVTQVNFSYSDGGTSIENNILPLIIVFFIALTFLFLYIFERVKAQNRNTRKVT